MLHTLTKIPRRTMKSMTTTRASTRNQLRTATNHQRLPQAASAAPKPAHRWHSNAPSPAPPDGGATQDKTQGPGASPGGPSTCRSHQRSRLPDLDVPVIEVDSLISTCPSTKSTPRSRRAHQQSRLADPDVPVIEVDSTIPTCPTTKSTRRSRRTRQRSRPAVPPCPNRERPSPLRSEREDRRGSSTTPETSCGARASAKPAHPTPSNPFSSPRTRPRPSDHATARALLMRSTDQQSPQPGDGKA